MGQMCLNNGGPFGHTGVARHPYPPWGDGSNATSHTMPHRGESCHLLYAVVLSFFQNLLQKGSREGGMVIPSALAVLRLMTNSNCVGCSTGRSAGLAPFRMRST